MIHCLTYLWSVNIGFGCLALPSPKISTFEIDIPNDKINTTPTTKKKKSCIETQCKEYLNCFVAGQNAYRFKLSVCIKA